MPDLRMECAKAYLTTGSRSGQARLVASSPLLRARERGAMVESLDQG